jgi:predicted ferric reductase
MRRAVLAGSLSGALALAVLAALGARMGVVSVPLLRPEGPALWLASRSAGITAYLALTLDVTFGLFLSSGTADRWVARARSVEVHRWLSGVTLALTGAHAAALVGDRFARFDLLDVLVPFLSPYRPLAVGLGVLAAWAAVAVHESFAWRSRLGQRGWRALHYLSFAVYLLATAHGLTAGTDARRPWMFGLHAASAGIVLWLAGYRALLAVAATRTAATLGGGHGRAGRVD